MPPITSPSIAVPEDVARYCAAHGIVDDLHLAIRLADEVFAPVAKWKIALEMDPDADEETVIIDAWISLTVEEALKRDSEFTHRFVAAATPLGMEKVVLIYNLI